MTEQTSHSERKYIVYIDDNFHFMDERERIRHSEHDTLEAAISEAKQIVDEFLSEYWSESSTAESLYKGYREFGDDPWISSGDMSGLVFNAWEYAKQRCEELCMKKA